MNLAEAINLNCLCITLQPQLLRTDLAPDRPHLFSKTPVFITTAQYLTIQSSVAALHRISALPGYQADALQRVAPIAAKDFGPQGVFMGYDFHISDGTPRLIEINTNAGGALLHAAATRAHRACCGPLDRLLGGPAALEQLDQVFADMFQAEWRAQRGNAPLRSVVIADDEPGLQYLAPEFDLMRQLLQEQGIAAVVTDPTQLHWRDGALWHVDLPEGMPVDLVYNRLTDFDLSEPSHASLRSAYISGAVVVTPHPRAHALHADKRNLVALSDDGQLRDWGVSEEDRRLLAAVVPATQVVTPVNAEQLWAQRRHLFFKPARGYGSKAAYRGEKLTRRVWGEIVSGNFVAQALVRPSERLIEVGGEAVRLKLDVRAYAYAGVVQLLAARTYAGQTTNFRTAGGGFAPVVVLPSVTGQQEHCVETNLHPCTC